MVFEWRARYPYQNPTHTLHVLLEFSALRGLRYNPTVKYLEVDDGGASATVGSEDTHGMSCVPHHDEWHPLTYRSVASIYNQYSYAVTPGQFMPFDTGRKM